MADVSSTPGSGRRCEAGHVMDPSWESCPYCDAEKRSKEQTQEVPHVSLNAASGRKTRVGEGAAGAGRRETKAMPSGPPSPPGGQTGESGTRRIVGVLITYTWRPEGQLFPIREGKNFIGADKVSSDASHRPCDICITSDPKLSAEHALILCRHGRYDLCDQKSSNGTFVNNELVPMPGIELPNYAQIKTGSTVWTFIKIAAAPVSQTVSPSPGTPEEEPTQPKPPDWTDVR